MKKTDVKGIVKTEYEVFSRSIPAEFDRFKIAHISDSHSAPERGILDIVCRQKPDITVITGDMLHDDGKPLIKFTEFLKDLVKIAPVYMVTGNHDVRRPDCADIFEEYKKIGAVTLNNERVILERDGKKIALFGICDPLFKKKKKISESIKQPFSSLERLDGYEILLFHRANLFDEIKDYGFDLILSGHMHGGQIQIPHFGGLLAPFSSIPGGKRMIFPKYCYGRFESGKTTMIVNSGMRNTLPVPRWGNPCEAGIITLRHIDTK